MLLCVAALMLSVLSAAPVRGEATGTGSAPTFAWLPRDDLSFQNIVDPNRIRFAARYLRVLSSDIPGTGNDRVGMSAGGRFGLIRLEGIRAQLSIEGGFDAQFDADHRQDNVGWDGNYGFLLTHRSSDRVVWTISALHTSSHLGDEYAERTGRRRIGYTRHEVALGISVTPGDTGRFYAEAAHGYDPGNGELQRPWRAEAGVELETGGRDRPSGWYAALDAGSWQEREWRIDLAAQAGYRVRSGMRTWRFGVEHVRGRPPLGEFFLNTERYLGFGAWLDV